MRLAQFLSDNNTANTELNSHEKLFEAWIDKQTTERGGEEFWSIIVNEMQSLANVDGSAAVKKAYEILSKALESHPLSSTVGSNNPLLMLALDEAGELVDKKFSADERDHALTALHVALQSIPSGRGQTKTLSTGLLLDTQARITNVCPPPVIHPSAKST